MSIHNLITLSGLLATASLVMTIVAGLSITKLHIKWLTMKWHTTFAVLTLILAGVHVGLVLFH